MCFPGDEDGDCANDDVNDDNVYAGSLVVDRCACLRTLIQDVYEK